MCNLNINIFRVGLFTFLVGVFLVPSIVSAQTVSKADAAKRAGEILRDLETSIYSDDKQGCERKAGMFVAFSKRYRDGEKSEGAFQLKMLDPLSGAVYARIRAKGLEKATVDNMKGYSACIKGAGVHKSPKKERDLTLKHTACVVLNDIILEAIDGIKRRKKPGPLMNKYEHKSPDMTWTNYASTPEMALYAIATLYKTSQTEKYEDVVQAASDISAGCYLSR